MRRFAGVLILGLVLGAAPAVAQPLPDTISSSALTRAQEAELNRRLARLQQRFDALASQMDLRASALRNVAVEIFGAEPTLSYETYVVLVEEGARQLRTYINEASVRTDADPSIAALRAQAIEAAQNGRLRQARGIYDQIIAANRAARLRAREAEDLADAADLAETGRLMQIGADYLGAERRYAEAAAMAPTDSVERWSYTIMQGAALFFYGQQFNDVAALDRAAHAYEAALLLRPRESFPTDWAIVQYYIAGVRRLQGERGATGALALAAAAYEATLSVFTREANPGGYAMAQSNLGKTFRLMAERGDASALTRAVTALEAALAARPRERDRLGWAASAFELARAYAASGRHEEARAMGEAARDTYGETGRAPLAAEVQQFIDALPR